jgi:hypothetical protein
MFLSRRGYKRRGRQLVGAGALAFALSCGTASAGMNTFCDTGVVHDYTTPLKRLSRIRPAPFGSPLSFGPARVFLGHFGNGSLQLGPGKRGFTLSFSPYEEGHFSPRLDWQVTSRLLEVDRDGEQVGAPETIEKDVKRLRSVDDVGHGTEFAYDVPGRPALYRVEIVFENAKGERLGRFGENFRVLRPSLDVGLVLNGTSFHRGETVRAWLLNPGVAFLFFGLGRAIEFNDGTAWTRPPVEFPNGPVPAIGLSLGPGEKASCWQVTIPADAVPGTYRFTERLDYYFSFLGHRRPFEASAEFTVAE